MFPQAGFCPTPDWLDGQLNHSWMGEVMLLIRPELHFHEYDLAKQPCIESGPSDDHKNAEKHHAGTKSFARLAGIHCAATSPPLCLNSVSMETAQFFGSKRETSKSSLLFQSVRFTCGVGGATLIRYLLRAPDVAFFRIVTQLCLISIIRFLK